LGFDFGQRTAGSAVSSNIAQRQQSFVGFVAADLSLRVGDPPLQDVAPIVDHPGSAARRGYPDVAVFDRLLHGVVRATA
jgi:hypothetical protein